MDRYDLAFVDTISSAPTVRLDLRGPWQVREGTTFGLPELRRAGAVTLLEDGDRYPAGAYGNRTISLVLQARATDGDARAAAMQHLVRELDRPTNILRYRPGTTEPVHFRTFRCGPDSIVWDPFLGEFRVAIPAEPFALGLPETIGPVTVYNDPWSVGVSSLSNGTFEGGVGAWTAQNGTVGVSSSVALSGTHSLRLTPTGGLTPVAARSELVPVTAGRAYQARVWVHSQAGWSDVSCALDWYDSGGSLISTSGASGTALAAGVWEPRVQDALAPAGAVTARVRARMGGTPAATDVLHVDDASMGERGGVGSNGMWVDLPAIKGDVETPLRITVPQVGGLVDAGRMSVMAIRRRGTPEHLPLVLQAEAMFQAVDTSVQSAAEDVSGRWSRTTFATPTGPRLAISTWPSSASPDVRGRYRVFARLRTTVATDVIYVQMRWGLTTASAGAPEVSVGWDGSAGYDGWKLIDLGLISFPAGGDPGVDGLTGRPLAARGQYLQIDARRQSGTGRLDWDYFAFVPADDRLAVIGWGDIAVAGGSVVIDSTTETIYPIDADGVVYGGGTPPGTTGWMMASPGTANRLFWLRSAGPLGADSIGSSTDLIIQYSPRYLYARPVAS